MVQFKRPVKALSFPPKTVTISFDPEKHKNLKGYIESFDISNTRLINIPYHVLPEATKQKEGQYSYTVKDEEVSFALSLLIGGMIVNELVNQVVQDNSVLSGENIFSTAEWDTINICKEKVFRQVYKSFSLHMGRRIAKELRSRDALNIDVFLKFHGKAIVEDLTLIDKEFQETPIAMAIQEVLHAARKVKNPELFYSYCKLSIGADLFKYYDYVDQDGVLSVWFDKNGSLFFGHKDKIGTEMDAVKTAMEENVPEDISFRMLSDRYAVFLFVAISCLPRRIEFYENEEQKSDLLRQVEEDIEAYPMEEFCVIPHEAPEWFDQTVAEENVGHREIHLNLSKLMKAFPLTETLMQEPEMSDPFDENEEDDS